MSVGSCQLTSPACQGSFIGSPVLLGLLTPADLLRAQETELVFAAQPGFGVKTLSPPPALLTRLYLGCCISSCRTAQVMQLHSKGIAVLPHSGIFGMQLPSISSDVGQSSGDTGRLHPRGQKPQILLGKGRSADGDRRKH